MWHNVFSIIIILFGFILCSLPVKLKKKDREGKRHVGGSGKVELFGGVEDKLLIQFRWDEAHEVHREVDDDVRVVVSDHLGHVDVLVLLSQDLFPGADIVVC
jgi:hypothetical protein